MTDYIIDSTDKKFGRVASEIAQILQGKKSPKYEPNKEGTDRVIVKNLKQIDFSLKKMKSKIHYSHTTQIGHLKKRSYAEMWAKNPDRVLKLAVKKMLPKNKLQNKRLKRLIIN